MRTLKETREPNTRDINFKEELHNHTPEVKKSRSTTIREQLDIMNLFTQSGNARQYSHYSARTPLPRQQPRVQELQSLYGLSNDEEMDMETSDSDLTDALLEFAQFRGLPVKGINGLGSGDDGDGLMSNRARNSCLEEESYVKEDQERGKCQQNTDSKKSTCRPVRTTTSGARSSKEECEDVSNNGFVEALPDLSSGGTGHERKKTLYASKNTICNHSPRSVHKLDSLEPEGVAGRTIPKASPTKDADGINEEEDPLGMIGENRTANKLLDFIEFEPTHENMKADTRYLRMHPYDYNNYEWKFWFQPAKKGLNIENGMSVYGESAGSSFDSLEYEVVDEIEVESKKEKNGGDRKKRLAQLIRR